MTCYMYYANILMTYTVFFFDQNIEIQQENNLLNYYYQKIIRT